MLYVDKGGYSSNGKIIPAELLPLLAKYTLPFNNSVKLEYCRLQLKFLIWLKQSHLKNKNFLSPIQSWSANFEKKCSPIQSWSGQNWLQSWSSPVLIRAHLCSGPVKILDYQILLKSHPPNITGWIRPWLNPCAVFSLRTDSTLCGDFLL